MDSEIKHVIQESYNGESGICFSRTVDDIKSRVFVSEM